MQTTLDTLKPGDQATVADVTGDPATLERLMEMGLTPGTRIKVLKYAPMGDPIEIVMRGYHLSLRRAEATGVVVETSGS